MRRLAALALLVALGGGCQTMTGRSAAQWADDRAVTARVKARLVAADIGTLTRVHVDTWNGTVYLTGVVDTPELKQAAETIARGLPRVQLVVNNLHVAAGDAFASDDAPSAAVAGDAFASDDAPSAAVAGNGPGRAGLALEHPALARATGLARLEPDTGTPGWTRYVAYDRRDRRAATVYVVPAAVLTREGEGDLPVEHAVERVAIYPDPAGDRFYVVFWRPRDVHAAPGR